MTGIRKTLAWGLIGVAISASACDRNPDVQPPPGSYTVARVELGIDSVRDSVSVATVGPEFVPASKVRALLGRLFVADEYAAGARPVVVLTKDTWVRRFHGDPTVIGKTVRLNGQGVTIVGVAPSDFPTGVAVWVPGPPK
jgi:hypothetical protein